MYLYFNEKSYVDYSNYKNYHVDQLITEGLETLDDKIRMEKYKEVQKSYGRGTVGIPGLSKRHSGAEGEPEGVHLLHLEQSALPGFQSWVTYQRSVRRARRLEKGRRRQPHTLYVKNGRLTIAPARQKPRRGKPDGSSAMMSALRFSA